MAKSIGRAPLGGQMKCRMPILVSHLCVYIITREERAKKIVIIIFNGQMKGSIPILIGIIKINSDLT